jgi:hypothetical protein
MRWLVAVGLGLVVVGAGAGVWWLRRPPPPPPEAADRRFFRQALVAWELARGRDGATASPQAARTALLAEAQPWPALAAPLAALDDAWPQPEPVRVATLALNRAIADAGLLFWLDLEVVRDRPLLLTYELHQRTPFCAGGARAEVMRVRRLDALNVEVGLLGHTAPGHVVVLEEMLEGEVLAGLDAVVAPEGNPVDREVGRLQRRALDQRLGPAVAGALLGAHRARREATRALRDALAARQLDLDLPETFALPSLRERFLGLTHPTRGAPVVDERRLDALEQAAAPLAEGPLHEALLALRADMALAVAMHEGRHAVSPEVAPPAALVRAADGDDGFARLSTHELQAYLGELHDTPGEPCLVLAHLAALLGSSNARETPHRDAAALLWKHLGEDIGQPLDLRLAHACTRPAAELRQAAADAQQELLGTALAPGQLGGECK